jgi:hypothetical protein
VDEGRKRMKAGSGWRQEVDGGRKWMEAGSGRRQEVDGGRKWTETGSGWRQEIEYVECRTVGRRVEVENFWWGTLGVGSQVFIFLDLQFTCN